MDSDGSPPAGSRPDPPDRPEGVPSPSARWPVARISLAAAANALLVATIVLAGCSPLPPGSPVPSGPAPSDGTDRAIDVAEIERGLAPVIEPAGRDLLAVIAPEEAIEATIDVGDAKRIAALAVARGLAAELVNAGTVLVIGARNDVMIFVADARPTRIELSDDHRADRWLPVEIPAIAQTNPGFPYLHAPLDIDRTELVMSGEQQRMLLGELARTIVTIDGRPYDRMEAEGECDAGLHPVCQLRAFGVTAGSGGAADSFLVIADATTGDRPQLASAIHGSVPRPTARAAEWVARHDPAGAAAITAFESCCGVDWDPARPGVITLRWWRPCPAAVAPPGRGLAETGDCFEGLEIVVDVIRRTVISIDRQLAP